MFYIIKNLNEFYKLAMLSSFADASNYSSPDKLIEYAENFDIKNEELFKYFDKFVEVYKEFVEELDFDISDLESDSFGQAAELAGKLQLLYLKMQELEYLELTPEEGYEEDFKADELLSLANLIMDHAREAIQNASGMEISDAAAAQIAADFNHQKFDKSNMNSGIRMTGDKVQQLYAAQRRRFQNLKLNYEAYQRYKDLRKQKYERAKAKNPDYFKNKKKITNQNQSIRNNKRKKLLSLIETIQDPKLRKEYERELIRLEENARRHLIRKNDEGMEIELNYSIEQAIEQAKKALTVQTLNSNKTSNSNKKERLNAGGMTGAIEIFTKKLAGLKTYLKAEILKSASKDPKLQEATKKLNLVGEKLKSIQTKELIEEQNVLQEAVARITLELVTENPKMIQVTKDIKILTEYRDKVKKAMAAGWISKGSSPEILTVLDGLLVEGEKLVTYCEGKPGNLGIYLANIVNELRIVL
jgi:hypothetical protein